MNRELREAIGALITTADRMRHTVDHVDEDSSNREVSRAAEAVEDWHTAIDPLARTAQRQLDLDDQRECDERQRAETMMRQTRML